MLAIDLGKWGFGDVKEMMGDYIPCRQSTSYIKKL